MGNLQKLQAGDTTALITKSDTWVDALNGIGGDLLKNGSIYQNGDVVYHRTRDTGSGGVDLRWLYDNGVINLQYNIGTESSPVWVTRATWDPVGHKLYIGHSASTTGSQLHIYDGSASNKPGLLVLYNDSGADYFFWVDSSGNLRASESQPSNDDTDGYIVWKSGINNLAYRQAQRPFAACEATDTFEIAIFVAPVATTITKVSIVPDGSMIGQDTNYCTFSFVNKGGSGGGTNTIGSKSFTSGNNLVAYDEYTDFGTLSYTTLSTGDVVSFKRAYSGTGLASPAGIAIVEYAV